MNRLFVELPTFREDWKELGLNDDQLRELQKELLQNPKAGKVIAGTGGVRKVRYALPGRGKSGSARVIYVDFEVHEKIYLLTAYAKNAQENLTKAERNNMKAMVEAIESALKGREQQ